MQHLFRLGVDIDYSDDEGFMALHHAVLRGFEDCVQELINWGSDVNAMTRHGGVALNLAAQKERRRVISILLGARADKAKAVEFAVARGRGVVGLCELLGIPVPVLEVTVSIVNEQYAVEEEQLPGRTTVNCDWEGSKIDGESSGNVKQLHPDTDESSPAIANKDEGIDAATQSLSALHATISVIWERRRSLQAAMENTANHRSRQRLALGLSS